MKYAKYALAALALGAISPVGNRPPMGLAQSIPGGPGTTPIAGQWADIYQKDVQQTLSADAASERDVLNLLSEYSNTQDEKKRSEIKTKIGGLLDQQFDHQ